MRQGSGKRRMPYRIKEWMADVSLQMNDLAAELGVHPTLVSHTIFGRKNSRRVLRALRDKGCPRQFLALPEDLENNGQEAA